MPAMGKRRSGPDKSKAKARARKERNRDPWDFPVSLPTAPVEVLAKITPLPPAWCSNDSRLTHSPAVTWIGMKDQPGADEHKDLIARWPFRIARSGERGGPYSCLALLAYESGVDIDTMCMSIVGFEDDRLLLWSGKHNVYVMGEEMADVRGNDPQSHAALDAVLARVASETLQQRAQRRWTQPEVVATPADPAAR